MPNRTPAEPRRRPQQRRSQRRVTKILDAAIQVFAERGYEAGTTTAVAERAGVSVGSLYQFFLNKEALLIALSARFDASFFAWIDAALTAEPQPRSLEAWVDKFFEALIAMDAQHPGLFQVLARAYTSPQFAADERHFNQEVARRVLAVLLPHAQHLAAARLEVIAAVCVNVTHALFHLASTDGRPKRAVLHEARVLLGAYLSTTVFNDT